MTKVHPVRASVWMWVHTHLWWLFSTRIITLLEQLVVSLSGWHTPGTCSKALWDTRFPPTPGSAASVWKSSCVLLNIAVHGETRSAWFMGTQIISRPTTAENVPLPLLYYNRNNFLIWQLLLFLLRDQIISKPMCFCFTWVFLQVVGYFTCMVWFV